MMRVKKIVTTLLVAILLLLPTNAMANNTQILITPTLSSISFKNATINEAFEPTKTQYTITLDNPELTPTLNDYKIDGDANIFVTYSTDETKHQTGIVATLEFEGGTTIYTFEYANAQRYSKNSENRLAGIDCYLSEVYPAINDKDTEYKLFIPSDMNSIRMTAITKDVNAYCDTLDEIALNSGQEPNITLTVTASDSSKRTYTFKVKRLKETSAQVEQKMQEPNFSSLVEGQLYYQKPVFFIAIICSMAGIIILALLVLMLRRIAVTANDIDELEFFDIE